MKIFIQRFIKRTIVYTGIVSFIFLLLLILLPFLFSGVVEKEIKQHINQNIDGKVNFSKARLSFFHHFPSLTLSLYDLTVLGSAPFKSDTLLAAGEFGLGINLRQLVFESHVTIDKIFVDHAEVQVLINEQGAANYNVLISDSAKTNSGTDSTEATIKLDQIKIQNTNLTYSDRSLQLNMKAAGLQYDGKGDFSKQVFRLISNVTVDDFDLALENEMYLSNKRIEADLITKINTRSLSFIFEHNKVLLNSLPVDFTGSFDFLENGYDLDFSINSVGSDLEDFITALPPSYIEWKNKTKIGGKGDMRFLLKGKYIASTQQMPSAELDVKIRNGYVQHETAPAPASDIFLNLHLQLPNMDIEHMQLKADSLYLKIVKDYIQGSFSYKGFTQPFVTANLDANMNLEYLDKAFGWQPFDMKGICRVRLAAEGSYITDSAQHSSVNNIKIKSIPSFQIDLNLKDGYFKYAALPQAIQQINVEAKANCSNHDYRNIGVNLKRFSATSSKNYIHAALLINNLRERSITARADAVLLLQELKSMLPVKNIDLKGLLTVKFDALGVYNPDAGKYPLVKGTFRLQEGRIKTGYYPEPVENIMIDATAVNEGLTPEKQQLKINNASFDFEGNKTVFSALFKNSEDPFYNVSINGSLELGNIYKVFNNSIPGMSGYIKANLHLKGRQSDALNRRYTQLYNQGTLTVKDFIARPEGMAKPLQIKKGVFRFDQDKMWFEQFIIQYGRSKMYMNGYMQNVPGYLFLDDAVLAGAFNLYTDFVDFNEWMPADQPVVNTSSVGTTSSSGPLVIPSNLNLKVTAVVNHILFNGVHIRNNKGSLLLHNGKLSLQEVECQLAGSQLQLNANYSNKGLKRALFDVSFTVKNAFIEKLYDSVGLFREMMTSAAKARGMISIDYQLKGALNSMMQPIYPSLEGSGVLSVHNAKFKGFRLLNAVSKATGKDSLANSSVSKVELRTSIQKNVISLERVKMKMAGFRLRLEGQTSFDGHVKFKMRLGLPPLGIIGIPISITGTQNAPKVKVGKTDEGRLGENEDSENDQ